MVKIEAFSGDEVVTGQREFRHRGQEAVGVGGRGAFQGHGWSPLRG